MCVVDVAPTADISTSSLQDKDDVPIIIILIVCIVGVFLLTLNVGLILFFIRRRRKKMACQSLTSLSHLPLSVTYLSQSLTSLSLLPLSAVSTALLFIDENRPDLSRILNLWFARLKKKNSGYGHNHN